jgi:serine O-acetyltransferase
MPVFRQDINALFELEGRPAQGTGHVIGTLGFVLTNPGVHAVGLHRLAHALAARGLLVLARLVAVLATALTGSEIDPRARIGPGFMVHHSSGVVIHAEAVIGERFRAHSGVVVGLRNASHGAPTIGDDVSCGSGAKLLGPIAIGDDVWVGANAVVVTDVPAHHDALGVPARMRPRAGSEAQA